MRSTSVNDAEQGLLKPGWTRPDLVAALASCVADWERALAAPVLGSDPGLNALVERSRLLEGPSRVVGFGGVGHHLTVLTQLAQPSKDTAAARQQLAIVQELLSSARASLTPDEQASARSAGAPPQGAVSPPRLISGPLNLPRPLGADLAPPRFVTSAGVLLPSSLAPAQASAPPAVAQRPLPIAAPPPPAPSVLPGPAAVPFQPVGAIAGPAQPNLFVRSMLGLRAFGRKDSPEDAAQAPSQPPAAARGEASLLGLGKRPAAPSAPPPALGGGYGGLPSLSELGSSAPPFELPGQVPGARARRSSTPPPVAEGGARRPSLTPSGVSKGHKTPSPLSSTPRRPDFAARGRPRYRGESGEGRWWIGALAALGVCVVVVGIVLVVVTVTRRRDELMAGARADSSAAPSSNSSSSNAPESALPRSRLLTDDERFRSLVTQVHGRGKESGELRALLEEQASLAAQSLQPGCTGPSCATLASVAKLVTATGKKRVKRRSRAPDTMRSRWLAGLEMPEIPVEDDPRVQKRFEFYTENPQGREVFQQMLFRCGAYRDTIQAALIRRGLPKDLIAVAYAESGCYPLAKSPAGAEGLWQFIPEAARAYHLRIIEDVVDERHSPQKSTDAAIQYYSDLYAKFGSWDLCFAAYNMGPFGLAARLERVEGEDVGFWELVDAQMLPDDTADYAPAIQAIALILNNLQRLKFGGIQQRAPQMTMDLQVPGATRLSLVARAAALSMDELRRLNLDIKGTATPNVANFAVQVPKDSVWQARDTLQELLKSNDESDLCAPANFDWGRQRFTQEMRNACARNLAARTAQPGAAPGAPP